eukprot:scaffold4.g4667.t1
MDARCRAAFLTSGSAREGLVASTDAIATNCAASISVFSSRSTCVPARPLPVWHARLKACAPLARAASRRVVVAAAGGAATGASAPAALASWDALQRWCIEEHELPLAAIEPAEVEDTVLGGQRVGFVTTSFVPKGQVILEIPGDLGVTRVDVEADPLLAPLAEASGRAQPRASPSLAAEVAPCIHGRRSAVKRARADSGLLARAPARAFLQGRSELVGLALWLMQERSRGATSPWAPLLACLPQETDSPLLWPEEERARLLAGSPVREEAAAREAALRQEWAGIAAAAAAAGGGAAGYAPAAFSEAAFLRAFSVVLAQAAFLPTAQCFALLPLVGGLARTGSAGGAILDYDEEKQAAVLTAGAPLGAGAEVAVLDSRPNGELLLATGRLEPGNPADCLTMEHGLVAADRLYSLKRQVVEDFGFAARQEFPITQDGITTQQLAYLRLARLQDPAQLAKARTLCSALSFCITFDHDEVVTVENEYEVLQLMMADLRDRLQAYPGEADDDIKDLQRKDLTARERLAAILRLGEKNILRGTMGGVRRRLAPIRGIPTKAGGLQDPNADLVEIFEQIEALPQAPVRLLQGLGRWWSGKDDPDWTKR